jgi:hypothetical protein
VAWRKLSGFQRLSQGCVPCGQWTWQERGLGQVWPLKTGQGIRDQGREQVLCSCPSLPHSP